MNSRYCRTIVWAVALSATLSVTPLWAQGIADDTDVPLPPNPAVEALLGTDPTTPEELVRAARIFAELQRPDLGKKMLARLMTARPTQQQWVELVEQLGSGMFTDLAGREELAPEARQVAGAALEAAGQKARDPKRIDDFIHQLQDPSVNVRSQALLGLTKARGAAIGRIMDVLADPTRESEHANLWAAMGRLGPDVVDPLIGMLERTDPRLMTQAARVLGQLDAKRAKCFLLGPYTSPNSDPGLRREAGRALLRMVGHLPSRKLAVEMLTERAREYLDDRRTLKTDVDGKVGLWRWDEGSKRCLSQSYTSHQANRIVASRLAGDAFALAPDDPKVKVLYLTAMLEAEACGGGRDAPLQEGEDSVLGRVTQFGVPLLEDTLERAVAENHLDAAAAAAKLLGRVGTAGELLYQGAQPAPLVMAVRHFDRRLRAAALNAVVRLQPTQPFAGSSYIPRSLAFFIATSGSGRVLMAGPNAHATRNFAATLAEVGYQVDTVASGREMIRKATASPDYQLAFIDMSIDDPPVGALLRRLRGDYRTADLRIGLVARDGQLERAREIAGKDARTLHFSRPHTADAFRWQLTQLDKIKPLRQVSTESRQHQAAAALDQLAALSETSGQLYDLSVARPAVLSAVYVPELSGNAIAVLRNDKSPQSQRALVGVINRGSLPVELRREALKAFRHNTRQNGILLTTLEIQQQYDNYNASADLDADRQHLLALVLDCLEAPTEVIGTKKD